MTKKTKSKKVVSANVMSQEIIESMIYLIRGHKVMLDSDLADLYGVQTGRLNEQVKRNIKRFPKDFMIRLTKEEVDILVSQNVIPSKKQMLK